MELTDKEIRLLARLSRDRGLYAECKGADLDALQELGFLQWFDARSSTTPFKQDPRPLLRLHGLAAGSSMLGSQLWKTGASSSGQKSLPRWTQSTNFPSVEVSSRVMENEDPTPNRLAAIMLPQRRLPQPIRDLLRFFLIGAVVGAVYGHISAVSDGAPLLGFGGLLRGVIPESLSPALCSCRAGLGATCDGTALEAAVPAASRH